jgi:hypothetical protein
MAPPNETPDQSQAVIAREVIAIVAGCIAMAVDAVPWHEIAPYAVRLAAKELCGLQIAELDVGARNFEVPQIEAFVTRRLV